LSLSLLSLSVCRAQDDKKLLVWDYNTPVPIKYISEPHMHSIPYIAPSPDGTCCPQFLG
jgi:hypothetical protein